ncbi:hypothetical protein M2310_005684 [Rhizobium leguminosarum]|uniref:Uncharacterized protein n=1 Tax=Rhizobium esperanzae TaxID=1967781 RepID=A0A7W6XZU8_9HYPH|nr:hypothetical protein [Rhizobium esperanzae]MDH6204997.1 hypothetical protein [Rhizobium leguminosarum]
MEFVAENPSPTPPHKGEGLRRCTASQTNKPATCSALDDECGEGRALSPSPLWGGVGEGFFPYAIGKWLSSRVGRHP